MVPFREDSRDRDRSGDRRTDPGVQSQKSSAPALKARRTGSPFYSATEEAFKTRSKGRFAVATAVALLTLVVIALFGLLFLVLELLLRYSFLRAIP